MYDKAVDQCFLVFIHISGQYNTQEICRQS